jgi:alpha-N-arabinofuranosidase
MQAKVRVYPAKVEAEMNRLIFGHFSEIAFGNIPGGFYDPGSRFADEDGFRTDVIDAMRAVCTPLIRFPGGNYVSNYRWENGIGPKEKRPRVYEYAWHAEDDNQFGTIEFIKFCRKVGAEPLICVNMGSGTVDEAMNWVEFCNGTGNTRYANLRRSLGYEAPFGVKYWGLGNEMYGVWQLNHLNASEYAHRAFQFAHGMKSVDPSIQLTASGIETDLDWNMEVVRKLAGTLHTDLHPLPYIDTLSAHHYSIGWDNAFTNADARTRMAISEFISQHTRLLRAAIEVATEDVHSPVKIAWDEWNMHGWAIDNVGDDRTYTLENAIVTASILNAFIRDVRHIGMANYSTFVNINGAISTGPEGLVKRPQYHVFELLGNHVGEQVVRTECECERFEVLMPHDFRALQRQRIARPSDRLTGVDYIDCVASRDGRALYVNLVNKHPDEDCLVNLSLMEDNCGGEAVLHTIYHEDIHASNTWEQPQNVATVRQELGPMDGHMQLKLRKHSINLLEIKFAV